MPALKGCTLHAGISYRNLLVVPNGEGAETAPPHDIVGERIEAHLPRGGDADLLEEGDGEIPGDPPGPAGEP